MLNMPTLKDRLFEIARDMGEEKPSNRFFEALLKISSGRVTQIFEPGAKTRLGSDSLSHLVERGYNPKWVNDGVLPKYLRDAPAPQKVLPAKIPGAHSKTADALLRALTPILLEQSATLEAMAAQIGALEQEVTDLKAEKAEGKAPSRPGKKPAK